MPFELARLLRGEKLVPAIAFAINVAIVAFMLYALWSRRRGSRAAPPA